MPIFSPDELGAVLAKQVPADAEGFCVGYSGGMDSTVLLHALAAQRASARFNLRAIHIDHQLHPQSPSWSEHCRRMAEELGVVLIERRVTVDRAGSEGLEAAARKARYDAMRALLAAKEVLLTAHHADDQLETMLLALLRGAGPRGLGGMRALQSFGPGWLARPLLGFTRPEIERWARSRALRWIEDPSNDSVSLDRNFLRHSVIPALRSRWPSAPLSAVRTGAHLVETADLLEELAKIDLQSAAVGHCLNVCELRKLSAPRRRNLLRYWLRTFGVRAPATRKLSAIDRDMLVADWDRSLRVPLDGRELRRHRQFLYCVPVLPAARELSLAWQVAQPLELAPGMGVLVVETTVGSGLAAAKLPARLDIRFRDGGERLQIEGARHRRPLKKLLQDHHVLPWWRGRLPLVYAGDDLVAVGDLWVSASYAAVADDPALRIRWQGRPEIIAQQPIEPADYAATTKP